MAFVLRSLILLLSLELIISTLISASVFYSFFYISIYCGTTYFVLVDLLTFLFCYYGCI